MSLLSDKNNITTEITTYLNDYADGKKGILDSASKKKIASDFRKTIISFIREKKEDSAWIALLLDMGKAADKAQIDGIEHSKLAEVLYMVMHIIRREIDPAVLQNAIANEKIALETATADYVKAKNEDQELAEVALRQEKVDQHIRRLAHLGEITPLLNLYIDEIPTLYMRKSTGTVMGTLLNATFAVFGAIKSVTDGASILGYQYAQDKCTEATKQVIRTFSLKPSRYLPLVVQDGGEGVQLFEKIFLAN